MVLFQQVIVKNMSISQEQCGSCKQNRIIRIINNQNVSALGDTVTVHSFQE